MEIIYRKAEDKDLDGVNKLISDNFGHNLKNIVKTNDKYSLVGIIDNKVVAHLFVTKIYNDFKEKYFYKIDDVCVDSNYRGMHIGTELMKKLEKYAKEDNIGYLELTSNKKRCSARALYGKRGFTIVDTDLFRKELV